MFLKVSVLALLVLSAYARSEEQTAEWMAIGEQWAAATKKCVVETAVDLSQFGKSLMNGDNRSLKCFYACMMKEIGVMGDDGIFNLEKSIEQVPEHLPGNMPGKEILIEGLTACATNKADDVCETAHLIFTCLHEKKLV